MQEKNVHPAPQAAFTASENALPPKLTSVMGGSFKTHAPLILLSWGFAVFVILLALTLGASMEDIWPILLFPPSYNKYLIAIPLLFFAVFFIRAVIMGAKEMRAGGGVRAFLLVGTYFDAQAASYVRSAKLWDAIAALTAMIPLSLFFCIGKSLIPHITSYSWDPFFARLDLNMHGGVYPHVPLVKLVEVNALQGAADLVYFLFFPFIVGINGFCIFCDPDHKRRLRYLWATLLSWIIGGFFLAIYFASVGPVFYADFYEGLSPYQDLTAYLFQTSATYDLHTVPLTRVLLEWVRDDTIVDINAISAMPSMHVGIAGLASLYVWKVSRPLGVLAWGFTGITLASTVYLGLHYAVDGYGGLILTACFWYFCGFLSRGSFAAQGKRILT